MDSFKFREKLQITQGQAAALLGVHIRTVSKWERGVLIPSVSILRLMEIFGKLTPDQIRQRLTEPTAEKAPPGLSLTGNKS